MGFHVLQTNLSEGCKGDAFQEDVAGNEEASQVSDSYSETKEGGNSRDEITSGCSLSERHLRASCVGKLPNLWHKHPQEQPSGGFAPAPISLGCEGLQVT